MQQNLKLKLVKLSAQHFNGMQMTSLHLTEMLCIKFLAQNSSCIIIFDFLLEQNMIGVSQKRTEAINIRKMKVASKINIGMLWNFSI